MERSRLPIIKTNKKTSTTKSLSQVNLDTSNINYFSSKFAQLKQAYLSSNNRHMKKSTSENSYFPFSSKASNTNNSLSTKFLFDENKIKDQNDNEEKEKEDLMYKYEVYGADYLSKFKKIKLNLFKNKFVIKNKTIEKNKENGNNNQLNLNKERKANNGRIKKRIKEDDEDKYLLQKNLWSSEISVKNDLNYDIGGNNESDSDDEFELEQERYRYREIKPIIKKEKDRKRNTKQNILYLTELQNSKFDDGYPLTIKNKRSNINDKFNKENFNIKQVKIIPDKPEKYKNPFIFKNYSSINNISHFHKVYRSFNSICRKHYVKGNSPSYIFIKSCDKEKIVCNPLGLLKRWGNEGSLDMNNQHTGDKYLNCLSSSLKFVNHINSLEMSNNRLTNTSIEKLITNIKQNDNLVKNLVKLNLSFNNIKEKGIENLINFIEDKSCQLENLNLEGNNLGDYNINNLCNSISQCLGGRLNYINLGKNKITKNSEQGLLAITDKCSELLVLILRNNQINNLLASKMMLKIKTLYSLKLLDFSWNLIGDHLIYPFLYEEAVNFHPDQKNLFNNFELDKIKTNMKIIFNKNPLLPKLDNNQNNKNKNNDTKDEYETQRKTIKVPERKPSPFAEEFSSYIKNPLCPLIHVNLSHNNLPYIDCELIAENAKHNHNILGFHVDGNEMKIDQLGFIIPIRQDQKTKSFYSKSQILYEAENYKDIPQVLTSHLNKMRNSNNCWVCECWNEVEFSLEINNKDIKPKYIVVKLHLDFENYAPCDMIYKKKHFKLVRMCPPGRVKYFFTIDGNPVNNCYHEFDYQIKEFEKPIKYTFSEDYIEQYNSIKFIDSESDENNNSGINTNRTNRTNVNKKYFGENIDIDIQEDQRDKNNKLISKTIYVSNYGYRNITPNNNIITQEYQSTLKFSIPRPDIISSRSNKQNPWKYTDSIWYYYNYNYEGETDDILNKMFEADFNLGEYDLIFINENDYASAKKLLKENYRKFISCYITLSSYSGNNIWQITSDVLDKWFDEKCENFINEEYNQKKIEKIYNNIFYNKKEVEERAKYKKYFPSNIFNLIRHSFMLFLVHISIDKFINLKSHVEGPFQALKYAMDNYFIKGFDNYDYHTWRKERYYNEEIDNYIKAFIPLIDGVFQTFSKKLKEKREKELKDKESLNTDTIIQNKDIKIQMTLEDFTNLIMSFINVKEFAMNKIPLIFHISKKYNINEVSDDDFLYLNFEEFCEALCRVIDIYSPYPPDEKIEDWPLEKRKEQFLVEKMENIMPTLYKKINHPKFNYIRDKFISPLKNQITSLYIIDYKSNNFYKGYEYIFEQNTNNNN